MVYTHTGKKALALSSISERHYTHLILIHVNKLQLIKNVPMARLILTECTRFIDAAEATSLERFALQPAERLLCPLYLRTPSPGVPGGSPAKTTTTKHPVLM